MSDPNLRELAAAALIVPIRSSSGESPDPERVPVEGLRHGSDEGGRFLAAYTSDEIFAEHGPPGSDAVVMPARLLFQRAQEAGERIVIDPGTPDQVEITTGALPFLAAGLDPAMPEALRARKDLGGAREPAPLDEEPQPFADLLRQALAELPAVERAWLLRSGDGWTAGIQLDPEAVLMNFDEVRNRLHRLATEQLGSRRRLAVTDLRAPSVREQYAAVAPPFYVRASRRRGTRSRPEG